ncbi:hypothetical protein [Palleronia abyssalis]|nr:hypothetical protein [Palleronia abyssalis]
MTNRIASVLGPLVVLSIWMDVHYDWGATLFLARELFALIEWMAFWR